MYQTVFEDFNHREGTIKNLQSIFKMRVESKEPTWSELPFELRLKATILRGLGDKLCLSQ